MSLHSHRDVFAFSWGHWRRHRLLTGAIIAGIVIPTVIDVFIPLASGRFIDALTAPPESGEAWRALALVVGLAAVYHLLRWARDRLLITLSATVMRDIAREAFAQVQRFSSDWHANAFAGATVRKITRGMWAIDVYADTLVFGLLPALLLTIGTTLLIALHWPLIGLALAFGIALYLAVTISLSLGWVAPAGFKSAAADSAIGASLADSIGANPTVRAFAAETREETRFAGVTGKWYDLTRITWNRSADSGLLQSVILIGLQAVMLGLGLIMWRRGQATTGDVVLLLTNQMIVRAYLRDIGMHVRNMQRSVNDMEDVVGYAHAKPDIVDRPGAPELRVTEGRIVFDDIRFRYDGQSAALYEGFSLEIKAGERVGLVGHSGSGKSTFVKLIQRLYDLQGGRILVDGQDIAGVTQASLRRAIGLVPQDPVLFHRALAENIRYGRPEASDEDVARAARLSHAEEFIARTPLGYETLVGERGIKLSGGERQRVAIARALLADTPILILDEATSSLDSESEHLIRDALDRLTSGRTTIVVAHRLATVERLDRILVFDRGRIIEQGTHGELIRRPDGHYRRLFELQMLGHAGAARVA